MFWNISAICVMFIINSNMTSFKRVESKPVVKIILIYDRLNSWRHRQFITIFYQFLHIRIETIHTIYTLKKITHRWNFFFYPSGNKTFDKIVSLQDVIKYTGKNCNRVFKCNVINWDVLWIRVITKWPNSEQSYKGKVKTHKYINRQNQSTTGKLWKQ